MKGCVLPRPPLAELFWNYPSSFLHSSACCYFILDMPSVALMFTATGFAGKVMEVKARRGIAPVTSAFHANQATLLYDVGVDQKQLAPLADEEIECKMIRLLIQAMNANDSPLTQYERLGLPLPSEATAETIRAACVTSTDAGQAYRYAHHTCPIKSDILDLAMACQQSVQ